MILVPCNRCGSAVPMDKLCPGHRQEVTVTNDLKSATIIVHSHIFYDHHVIGHVGYSTGVVQLYCDGHEA